MTQILANIRKINEEARVSSENVRIENEANRIEQEANRVKAEQLRKDNYNFIIIHHKYTKVKFVVLFSLNS